MDDKEVVQNFGDLVDATDKMSTPWREISFKLIKALVITNLFWAIIVGILLLQPKKVVQIGRAHV